MSNLDELARLEAAATPGPWRTYAVANDAHGGEELFGRASGDAWGSAGWSDRPRAAADAALIAAARNALPDLLAEIARLRAAARQLIRTTEDLDRWDVANGYVVNSERDALAGDVAQAWADLAAALEPTP